MGDFTLTVASYFPGEQVDILAEMKEKTRDNADFDYKKIHF
ncbi:hypothetical protein [Cellulosilyticum ruminicola]|nr:hypothetical protein [Cellulosilyticum ruminicola]